MLISMEEQGIVRMVATNRPLTFIQHSVASLSDPQPIRGIVPPVIGEWMKEAIGTLRRLNLQLTSVSLVYTS